MTKRRKVIVHIAASADGYIARPDDDLEWLTSRPAPESFYGMNAFMKTIDTKLLGRKTYEMSLRLGEKFTWWLIQLTKRDVAVLFFVFLAAIGQPAWILHLLFGVTAISLALALNAQRNAA